MLHCDDQLPPQPKPGWNEPIPSPAPEKKPEDEKKEKPPSKQ